MREQTHSRVQHIVIDGGSTDGTLDILHAHRDQIDSLISEPDDGIYDALNKGIARATGDVVGVLHAGDMYASSEVLARVADTMSCEPIDALCGDVAFFNTSQPSLHTRRYRSSHFRPDRIGWGWMPAHPALFVRREVFDRVGTYRTDYRISGDFEWIARAFGRQSQQYRCLPEVLVLMSSGGISTAGWRNTWLLNREVMRACRENGISTNWLKILSKYPFKLVEFLRP